MRHERFAWGPPPTIHLIPTKKLSHWFSKSSEEHGEPVSKKVAIHDSQISYDQKKLLTVFSKNSCNVFSNSYFFAFCFTFRLFRLEDKMRIVIQEWLCYSFPGRHNVHYCYIPRGCEICNERHHSTLYFDKKDALVIPTALVELQLSQQELLLTHQTPPVHFKPNNGLVGPLEKIENSI